MPTDSPLHVLHATTHQHTGAGRAAVRIHRAVAKSGIHSEMLVLHGSGKPPHPLLTDLRHRAKNALLSLQSGGDGGYRSFGFGGGPGLAAIRGSSADIVHLHWIPELLGIADLPRIGRPVVWTFHDQWPICGTEHYTTLARPRLGYEAGNRGPEERGPDFDRWIWRRKRASWKTFAPVIVCPSRWLAAEVRASLMFRDREIHVLPYPLDTALYRPYRPQERTAARSRLGLPADRTLLVFGAWGATSDRRKGFHVLSEALRRLSGQGLASNADLVIFGAQGSGRVHDFNTHWMGFIEDESVMSGIYSACDVFVIPSLQDNLPNTLIEAMACGLPAVGSDTGGIPDLIRHGDTGLLAAPDDAAQLADRLEQLLRDAALRSRMGEASRQAILAACDEQTIGRRYAEIYRSVTA